MTDRIFCILDTETTGLESGEGHRIVEIAAVLIRGDETLGTFETFVNPERSIPPAAGLVNRITPAMLAEAPKFGEILGKFQDFLGRADVALAHNAEFDQKFLDAEAARIGRKISWPPIVCTKDLSKRFFPEGNGGGHSLDALAGRLGVESAPSSERHRALGDVLMTARVVRALAARDPELFARMLPARAPAAGSMSLFG